MDTTADRLARIVWDYHRLNQKPVKSDAIFVLCSIDTRVAERAVELFEDGFGQYVIFSGGIAHEDDLLRTSWDGPEAEHFAAIARRRGIPDDRILIESKAQNTGQNIQFTYRLLAEKQLQPKSVVLVQKPYMERRTYATFMKQWPDRHTRFTVTSPNIEYDDYFNDANPKEPVINIMVGDLQRTREYPKLGFQIEQSIPEAVWSAYNHLIRLGYNRHLLPKS